MNRDIMAPGQEALPRITATEIRTGYIFSKSWSAYARAVLRSLSLAFLASTLIKLRLTKLVLTMPGGF